MKKHKNSKTLVIFNAKSEFFSPINLMFQTLKRINDMNLPPVFGFVYDEFWYIQYQIEDLLNVILGKLQATT